METIMKALLKFLVLTFGFALIGYSVDFPLVRVWAMVLGGLIIYGVGVYDGIRD